MAGKQYTELKFVTSSGKEVEKQIWESFDKELRDQTVAAASNIILWKTSLLQETRLHSYNCFINKSTYRQTLIKHLKDKF